MSPRADRALSWISLRWVLGAVALTAFLILTGREVDRGYSTYMFELIAVGGVGALALFEPGAFMGVMVLAAMNGIPFVNTSHPVAAHITEQDLVCLIFIGVACAWLAAQGRDSQPTRIARTMSWCGLALVVWCAFTVLRGWAAGDASILAGVKYGRDFVYFGVLLMLLPRVRLRERDIKALVSILGVGVLIFSVGQFLTAEGIANPTYITHPQLTNTQQGLTRVYAEMNDLLLAGVAFGIAAIVLAPRRKYQLLAVPVTVMLTASVVVELTRARWIALIVSIVVVGLWLALQGERRLAVTVRRRLGVVLASLFTVIVGLFLLAPSVLSSGTAVQRLLSIFTDIGSSSTTSTVDVRTRVAGFMLQVLGGRWPIGVGLIPPKSHYYASLPQGGLRDSDVGVLNAVMTIGVIGAALIYLPLIVVLVYSMGRMRAGAPAGYAWMSGGGQIWIVATLVSSITLATLYSVSGLVMSALILMLLCERIVSGEEPVPARAPRARAAPARWGSALPDPRPSGAEALPRLVR